MCCHKRFLVWYGYTFLFQCPVFDIFFLIALVEAKCNVAVISAIGGLKILVSYWNFWFSVSICLLCFWYLFTISFSCTMNCCSDPVPKQFKVWTPAGHTFRGSLNWQLLPCRWIYSLDVCWQPNLVDWIGWWLPPSPFVKYPDNFIYSPVSGFWCYSGCCTIWQSPT